MDEISKERFEAWLFSQPFSQEFEFGSTTDCLVCAFLKSETGEGVSSGGNYSSFWSGRLAYKGERLNHLFWPDWLMNLELSLIQPLTIANAQKRYLELFPNSITLPEDQKSPDEPAGTQTSTGSHLALAGC